MAIHSTLIDQSLKDNFGLEGKLELIYGEVDLNYRLTTSGGDQFLVKIGGQKGGFKHALAQQELTEFLADSEVKQQLSRPVKTSDGALVTAIDQHPLRVLTWLPGKL